MLIGSQGPEAMVDCGARDRTRDRSVVTDGEDAQQSRVNITQSWKEHRFAKYKLNIKPWYRQLDAFVCVFFSIVFT